MSKEDLPPSRTAEQFVVRFPDGMRDRIAEAAKVNGRSMNAEIVNRLEGSFRSVDVDNAAGMLIDSQRLQEMVDAQRKTIGAQEINIIMLATHIIDLINQLPKRMQDDPHVRDAAEFALSLDIGEKILGFHVRTGTPMQVSSVEIASDDAPRDGVVRIVGGSEAIQAAETKRLSTKQKKR